MGARGSVSITRGGKPKKKSRFSAQEKVERARVGARTKRIVARENAAMAGVQMSPQKFLERRERRLGSMKARGGVAEVRARYKRNPVPRANRTPVSAPGGGAPRRRRG